MASQQPTTYTYKTAGKLEVKLDVYVPSHATNAPVLLWFHGGGLLQGTRSACTPHLLKGVDRHNHILVSADYRLAPQVGVAEILDDVRDCIKFIRTELPQYIGTHAIDTSRLAVSGSSAGGYLALLSGLYVDPKPDVILAIYPITDPKGRFFTTEQPMPFNAKVPDVAAIKSFLDPKGEVMADNMPDSPRNTLYFHMLHEANLARLLKVHDGDDTYRVAKKIHECGLPPTYVVHGDADGAVGVEQADEVVGVLTGLGMTVEYERLHGVDHLFDKDDKVELERMYRFMKAHL